VKWFGIQWIEVRQEKGISENEVWQKKKKILHFNVQNEKVISTELIGKSTAKDLF